MIFHKRVEKAKPLWRRSSESNLASLQEISNDYASDVGPHASTVNSLSSEESSEHTVANSHQEGRISTPLNQLTEGVCSPGNNGKGVDRTVRAAQRSSMIEEGHAQQGSLSPTHSATSDSDSRESEKSWVKA